MSQRFISAKDVIPDGWKDLLTDGPIAIGIDPATTTKAKSNPTGLSLIQKVGYDYVMRLGLRYKTADPDVTETILRELSDLPDGKRVRRICILATNERYWAVGIRKRLYGKVPVELVIESESIQYGGESMLVKAYLGNLVVNAAEDGHLLLPNNVWVKDDFRQVMRERGTFVAAVDENGNHADLFGATGAGLHGLISRSGPVAASATATGSLTKSEEEDDRRRGWIVPGTMSEGVTIYV